MMSKKHFRKHQKQALDEIVENQKKLIIIAENTGKTLIRPVEDDIDKDEWGYPRRYSESGW